MTNRFTAVAPFRYTIVDVAFVRIYQDSSHNRRGNRRENTCLLYVRQHLNRNRAHHVQSSQIRVVSLSQESLAHEPLSDGYVDSLAQLFGHLLNITRIRVEFVSNPAVGQI